jgi:signal transduction histidine kinase
MLAWLRDLPIRRKLTLAITFTSAVALLMLSGTLLIRDVIRFRQDLGEDLRTLAAIVADNSTAALSFEDAESAEEMLAALSAKPHVTAAALYTANGRLFAAYSPEGTGEAIPDSPGEDGYRQTRETAEVTRAVELEGRRIGSIFVRSSLTELYSRLRARAITVGLVLLASWLLTLLLSSWLRRLVADPLLDLTATARAVSARQDYSLRARSIGRDEIGLLVTAFNDMLSQIERRDAALLQATGTLEMRVAERTAQLEQELSERHRAERELERRNEELQHTNRELDDFAYIASHDLKEPLRGIHNYSRFLLEDHGDRLDAEGREKLETLSRLSRRMEQIIDSLLHYSRLGRTEPVLGPVDTQALVEEVLETLAISVHEHGAEVRVPGPLPAVRGDRVLLGEVFANLITNAMKYNDKPNKQVEIGLADAHPRSAPDERVLYVRDNGIGIPERHIEGVFRIFKRLHARDAFGGGSGAGLTIVRKIIERQGGRIWIESAPGEGTTVFFTLQGAA